MVQICDDLEVPANVWSDLKKISDSKSYLKQACRVVFSQEELANCGFRIIGARTKLWDPKKLDILYCTFFNFNES